MTGSVIRQNQMNLLNKASKYLEEALDVATELNIKGELKDDSLSIIAELSEDLDYLKSLSPKQLHLEEILDMIDILQGTRDALIAGGTIYVY